MRAVTAKLLFEIPHTPWTRELREYADVEQDGWGQPFVRLSVRLDDGRDRWGVYRTYRLEGTSRVRLPVPDTHYLPACVAPIAGGRWVLAATQGSPANYDGPVWQAPGVTPTAEHAYVATIFSAAGVPESSFSLGAYIAHIQVTPSGRIWTGATDQGIYDSESPLDRSGLACVDPDGAVLLEYLDLVDRFNVEPIGHCYTLNVSSEHDTWVYYIDDGFHLVRLVDFEVNAAWQSPIKGADAFAVHGSRVLFTGHYRAPNALNLVDLRTGSVESLLAVDENGSPIVFSYPALDYSGKPIVYTEQGVQREQSYTFIQPCGRGSRLYLRSENALYQIDLAEIP